MLLQEAVAAAHRSVWERFVCADSDLLYDFHPDLAEFPTPEEIAADRPNSAGWTTDLQDCALNGSTLLCGLLLGAEHTGSTDMAAKARRIARGLIMLATTSDRKGFLIRGMSPGSTAHYRNSSVDQYTHWLVAMWDYFHSPLCDGGEKAAIRQAVADVCERISGDGERVLTEDGEPAIYCDFSPFRWERSCRLLLLYRVGADITGDSRWMDLYLQRRDAEDRRRLRDYLDSEPPATTQFGVWSLTENQFAYRALYKLETDPQVRQSYLDALAHTARTIAPALDRVQGFDPRLSREAPPLAWRPIWQEYMRAHPGADTTGAKTYQPFLRYYEKRRPVWNNECGGVRDPLEAAVVILYSEDDDLIREHATKFRPLLCAFPYGDLKTHYGGALAELAYYLGVKNGLWAD